MIVEPFSGSAGVIVPPVGYLQKLRRICDEHGILLIFDEVITAFGVKPDILTFAKQVTNGAVPMGGVVATSEIHDVFMATGGPDYAVEFRTATPIRPILWHATLQFAPPFATTPAEIDSFVNSLGEALQEQS